MVSCSRRQQQQPQEMAAAAAAVWVGGDCMGKKCKGANARTSEGRGACWTCRTYLRFWGEMRVGEKKEISISEQQQWKQQPMTVAWSTHDNSSGGGSSKWLIEKATKRQRHVVWENTRWPFARKKKIRQKRLIQFRWGALQSMSEQHMDFFLSPCIGGRGRRQTKKVDDGGFLHFGSSLRKGVFVKFPNECDKNKCKFWILGALCLERVGGGGACVHVCIYVWVVGWALAESLHPPQFDWI